MDDDCIPAPALLEHYAQSIETNKGCQVFEGRISAIGEQTRFDQECPLNENGGNLWSCNFCVLKSLFHQLNGFDEAFPYAAMEDIDFKTRVSQSRKIIFCQKARVFHPWKTIHHPSEKFEKSFISCKIFLEKWPDQNKHFSSTAQVKKLISHFLFQFIPKVIKFRFRGLGYVFSKYRFMLRLAYHQMTRGFFF